ncbi:Pachytene checkpoint protein 2 [Entomortierella lignicola]|nr:Pachytene checkpoint protein 2 [Entomortierella lignicola]
MKSRIHDFLYSNVKTLRCFQEITEFGDNVDELVQLNVEKIWVGERVGSGSIMSRGGGINPMASSPDSRGDETGMTGRDARSMLGQDEYDLSTVDLALYVYQVHDQGPVEEYGDSSYGEETATMAHHWTLPCEELEGVWDSLIFEDRLQVKLLEYVRTTILFSDKNVNPDLISWNRVVLLHGPPGTGKTSLCRGLAQKLSIRLHGRYRYGKLLEINSHSLFSKWFSESGKMVQRMFDQIWSMVEDDNAFVCVLIDEVESLAAARRAALSGNEPSDSIRVVNALLTQIDRLKKQKNVLILTTSNITEAIDIAFIDRADIKLHIGLPSQQAIYKILATCIEELQRAAIIQPQVPLMVWNDNPGQDMLVAERLYQIAGLAIGMSGRAIRKLPFLAHAGYIQSPATTMDTFLVALHMTIVNEQQSCSQLDTFVGDKK